MRQSHRAGRLQIGRSPRPHLPALSRGCSLVLTRSFVSPNWGPAQAPDFVDTRHKDRPDRERRPQSRRRDGAVALQGRGRRHGLRSALDSAPPLLRRHAQHRDRLAQAARADRLSTALLARFRELAASAALAGGQEVEPLLGGAPSAVSRADPPLSSGGWPLARPARGSGAGNSGRLRPGPTRAPSPVGYACRFARPAVPWRQAR
jgi:hypothetical protein